MRTFRTEFEIENLGKNDIHVLAQEEVQFERKPSSGVEHIFRFK